MGMFFHFDDYTEEELKEIESRKLLFKNLEKNPTLEYVTEDGLRVGDIICSAFTEDFKLINEFYITRITEDKRIFGHPISRETNTTEEEWMWSTRIKICSAIGEYDKDTMGV